MSGDGCPSHNTTFSLLLSSLGKLPRSCLPYLGPVLSSRSVPQATLGTHYMPSLVKCLTPHCDISLDTARIYTYHSFRFLLFEIFYFVPKCMLLGDIPFMSRISRNE